MAKPDWEAEGLLKGLRGRAREARAQLLDELHQSGVSLEELREATAEERLALVPVERVLADEGRYTAREVADRAGVDVDVLIRRIRALGLPVGDPDERRWTEEDLEAARRSQGFAEAGWPEEAAVEIARVIGQSMARIADAVRVQTRELLSGPGDTERDVGLRLASAARDIAPMLGPTFEYVFRAHLREQVRTAVVSAAALSEDGLPGSEDVAVCFADLVGFTRLGSQIPADELGGVAGRLEAMASERVEPPVRLVKTIGDAVMLVAPEPAPMVRSALDLVTAAESGEHDIPPLRAGVAFGPALSRGGDWYGHPVNLASRLTGIARPDSVLTTEEVHDALEEAFRWSFAGQRRVKGVGEVKLFRPRFADAGDRDEPRQRKR
jgi:adenylate cyclase